MKIDNIDSIVNKEKSPDKAERTTSIEDIKKSQSKFYEYTNDLAATATATTATPEVASNNLNNNLIENNSSSFGYVDSGTSKLKKLLLNSDPEVANLNEYHNEIKNEHQQTSSTSSSEYHNSSIPIDNENKKTIIINNVAQSSTQQLPPPPLPISSSSSSNKQKLFLCSECNEYFLKLNLFNHMKCVHNKFTCLYCYGFFEKVEKLHLHLVRKHKVQNFTIYDEQTLRNCFEIKSNNDGDPRGVVALLGAKNELNSSKVVNAMCCKCASILNVSESNLHTHNCGGSGTFTSGSKSMALNNRKKNSAVHKHQQDNSIANLNQNLINSAKEDVYCEQAIQQWLQPSTTTSTNVHINNSCNNSRTTFNGALNEISSQTHVPPSTQLLSSANTSSSSMMSSSYEQQQEEKHQQQKIMNNSMNENNNNNDNSKLVVPKLTLKIPKAALNNQQTHHNSHYSNKNFDNINSDEDSGDEEEDSSSSSEVEESEVEESDESEEESKKHESSSLSENDDKENEQQQQQEIRRPENMPSLKLKIKNLTSNPESVLENFSQISHATTDVDLSECPMDLEDQQQQQEKENEKKEVEEEMEEAEETKKIIIDGVEIIPVINDDFRPHEINLDEALDKIDIRKFMKICLRASYPFCLYCNHARKIVVNGKYLAIHFITHHRFHAMVDSITAEELHPEKIVGKFVASMDELKDSFFNLDSYDDHDKEKSEGHVTISHDKLYECFQCRFQTGIHKELYLHNRKMHAKLLINCLMCKMSFYSYSELLCHICPGVPNKQELYEYKYACCLCNFSNIPSAFRLMVHLRKRHFACDVCLEKCSDQGKLSSHVWKHKLMHICYRCHVFYQNKADIMRHLFWKHGTEGVECKKCLQKKWKHIYHFCIPPPIFNCTQCEMTFTRAIALKVHLRLHDENAQKYSCTELGCEKKFISTKLLLHHQDRHESELAALENGDDDRSERTVIIPKEIPEGLTTRVMPVIFKRFIKKPAVRKNEDEIKVEEKIEEVKKEEKKTLPDLPETNLNLSESSDDEDDSSLSEDGIKKKPLKTLTPPPSVSSTPPPLPSTLTETIKTSTLVKASSLTDSEEDDEANEPMKNIFENLKSFQESQNTQNTGSVAEENKDNETIKQELKEEEIPDKLPDKVILHVCQSDHDYAQLWRPAPGTTKDDLEDMIKSQKIDKDKNKKKDLSQKSNNIKNKKKSDDFSSSDSSSGSSSDSSSGSSSGSSSSGSSSSTSDSSSSEASSLNTSKPRNKKYTKKRSKKEKKAEMEAEEIEIPRDPDDIINESDLMTDETDTDEDFYDKHPLKDSQKQQQALVDGTVENSRPPTPLLPPVVEQPIEERNEKRNKLKKRKREHKKLFSSPNKRHKEMMPMITSTPIPPRIELHQANQIRQLLQSTQQQPVLPILKEQPQPQYDPYISVSRVTSAASSRMNSDTESAIKRSQRKRIPNKFYGYTSDDESMAAHAALNDPFKPIPPPNLTWRKEDLPSRSKSPPKVAPIKLNLTDSYNTMQEIQHHQSLPIQQVNHSINNRSDDEMPSSDDDNQLYISEPRKRKRKAPNQSMYAFHTLETPPTVSQPPIPRLKLTIGSNNKIRRRNINPLKPPAKKRKIANKSFNDLSRFGGGAVKKASFNDLQLSARILKSPPPPTAYAMNDSEPMTVKKAQENLEKQQKLEEAIQSTQMYFQRYNHTQVGGNAEIAQETATTADGDGRVYCYCRRAYDEQQGMIGCDGPQCQIEWFHFECVGILVPPRGSWYCPQCQKEQHQF